MMRWYGFNSKNFDKVFTKFDFYMRNKEDVKSIKNKKPDYFTLDQILRV